MKRLLFLFVLCLFPACAFRKNFSLFDKTNVVTEEYHVTRNVKYSNPKDENESKLIERAFNQKDTFIM